MNFLVVVVVVVVVVWETSGICPSTLYTLYVSEVTCATFATLEVREKRVFLLFSCGTLFVGILI